MGLNRERGMSGTPSKDAFTTVLPGDESGDCV